MADLAKRIGIDRSTVLHHARVMVTEGTAAIGTLRELGASGRPPRIVIDADRLSDLDRSPTLIRELEVEDRLEKVEIEYEIVVEEGPDEYAHPRVGPVTRALAEGALTDELAAAIASTVSDAILADLRRGRATIQFVLLPDPDEDDE